MKLKIKIPKKLKNKVKFTTNLLVFGVVFYVIWLLSPTFHLLKFFTAKLIAYTTGSIVVTGVDGIFIRRGSFLLQIITDCTAWKEIFVFLALFFSWPKKKSYKKGLYAIAAIFLFNLLRLDFLVLFQSSFDYFHPLFQYMSIAIILLLWTWSVGITTLKIQYGVTKRSKTKKKKAKKRKKK
ncbi:MAG: hypothetical protein GOV01_03105 [Candidatus Altiarchaeota archaeon]|nr:hypothetical protein [Candidatus Altiarchaeota archaeon]